MTEKRAILIIHAFDSACEFETYGLERVKKRIMKGKANTKPCPFDYDIFLFSTNADAENAINVMNHTLIRVQHYDEIEKENLYCLLINKSEYEHCKSRNNKT